MIAIATCQLVWAFRLRMECVAKALLRVMVLVRAAHLNFFLSLDRIDFTPYVEVSKLDCILRTV
jgi:hypothetical protein